MAQPPTYTRQYDFSDYQDDFPDDPLPGNQVDIELNTVRTSLNAAIANLGLIQADDGGLVNAIVLPEKLSNDTLALLTNGITYQGDWVTATAYAVGDAVKFTDGATYICATAHTSGTFATDLAAGKWMLLANPVGSLGAIVFAAHNGDGATTAFSLPVAIIDEKQLFVFVGGSITNPETAYTVSGTTITFAVAPPSGTNNILIFGVDITAAVAANEAAASAAAAATSETNAASSATSAASSATTATTQATNASNSASAAATSETNAAASATSASSSATTATTQASNASTSASSASTSATNASNSATAASGSATTATTQATNAANSASAASTSATNASNSASAASTSATNASNSASAASTSASNAATSETNAAASAASAAATLASALWRDVVFKTSSFSVTSADNGKLFVCDTSGGAITITMPQIATLTMPFQIGIKKETSDGNAVTINRTSPDVFDSAATSKTIVTAATGCTLLADTDPAPDQWTAVDFGAVAGNMTSDIFSGTGAQTDFTLTVAPGSVNNVAAFISGVRQRPTTDYTLSGTTLTFTTAPASGTNNILCVTGTTLSIGTPSDATVTAAKLASTVVSGLTEDTSPDTQADYVLSGDTSAAAPKKVLMKRLTPYRSYPLMNIGGCNFNGSTTYLDTNPLTGIADGKKGTFFAIVRFANAASATERLFSNTGTTLDIIRSSTGNITIVGKNSGGSTILSVSTTGTPCSAAGTYFIMASWDLATAGSGRLYINDTSNYSETTFTNDTIDYTVAEYSVGATVAGANFFAGDFYTLWFDAANAVDFSAIATRRNFIDDSGIAVFLGTQGTFPTGSAPTIFLAYDQTSNWAIDRVGTITSTFTVNGTPANPTTALSGQAGPQGAPQAAMESGSIRTKFVTPAMQHFHPGHPKCWGRFDTAGGVTASYNITSVTDTGTGVIGVTIATDFSGAGVYSANCSAELTATTYAVANDRKVYIRNGTLAAGTLSMDCIDSTATTNLVKDPQSWHFVAFGDQ